MEEKTYIQNLIKQVPTYKLTREDENTIKHEGIETFIYKKLNSSKYRATKTESTYDEKVKNKIMQCVKTSKPIHLSLPFGATKSPYNVTAPNIDWAEVFNIAFLREYLSPIASAYKHGITLEYVSVAVFEELVNRIPQKDSKIYDEQFSKLIKLFQGFLPKGLNIRYSRVEDTIPREIIEERMKQKIESLRKDWDKQSKEVINEKLFRANRNCLFQSGETATDEMVLNSALGHDAFCSECWTEGPANWDKEDMITLGHRYTNGWSIHVKSAPGSTVNFWSGIGALVVSKQKFIPTVFSHKQFSDISTQIIDKPVDIVELTNISTYFKDLPTIQK